MISLAWLLFLERNYLKSLNADSVISNFKSTLNPFIKVCNKFSESPFNRSSKVKLTFAFNPNLNVN